VVVSLIKIGMGKSIVFLKMQVNSNLYLRECSTWSKLSTNYLNLTYWALVCFIRTVAWKPKRHASGYSEAVT